MLDAVLSFPRVVLDMALEDDATALAGVGLDIVLGGGLIEADAVETGRAFAGLAADATEPGRFQDAEACPFFARALG